MDNSDRKMATRVDEIDAAVHVVVSPRTEIATLKSTYVFVKNLAYMST